MAGMATSFTGVSWTIIPGGLFRGTISSGKGSHAVDRRMTTATGFAVRGTNLKKGKMARDKDVDK